MIGRSIPYYIRCNVPASKDARDLSSLRPPVGGRFRIERELGAGGMGTVYEATDLETGARVALKTMRSELLGDARAVERFRREGAALAAVRHPCVVEVVEVGALEDGTLYIAMELLRGETLRERLARAGTLSPERLLPLVLGLAEGLEAVHASGVIHRDIKPSNIHLPSPEVLARAERTGERAPVKIVDFGVARVRGLSKMTSTGIAIGTVRYMAPEQLAGGAIDERVDVYALGVVLYEALAGEHPFRATEGDDPVGAILIGRSTPLSSLRPDLSPAVVRVVHTAMARLARERFASPRALADAFRRAVLEGVAPPGPPGLGEAAGLGFASTVRAAAGEPSEVPSESKVRARRAPSRRRRPPLWLFAPLLAGVCLVPTLGVAGFAGLGRWVTGRQMHVALRSLRLAVESEASLARYEEPLASLESLHGAERVNLLAAAAFNARVQRALRSDGRIDAAEVEWIMEVVQDIDARGGDYTLERYGEMTGGGP